MQNNWLFMVGLFIFQNEISTFISMKDNGHDEYWIVRLKMTSVLSKNKSWCNFLRSKYSFIQGIAVKNRYVNAAMLNSKPLNGFYGSIWVPIRLLSIKISRLCCVCAILYPHWTKCRVFLFKDAHQAYVLMRHYNTQEARFRLMAYTLHHPSFIDIWMGE